MCASAACPSNCCAACADSGAAGHASTIARVSRAQLLPTGFFPVGMEHHGVNDDMRCCHMLSMGEQRPYVWTLSCPCHCHSASSMIVGMFLMCLSTSCSLCLKMLNCDCLKHAIQAAGQWCFIARRDAALQLCPDSRSSASGRGFCRLMSG